MQPAPPPLTPPPGIMPPLVAGASRKELVEIDINTYEAKICNKKWLFDNIAASMILKIMYGERWRIIDPGVNDFGCATILYNPVSISPPQIMVRVSELLEVEQKRPRELYGELRGRIDLYLVHPAEIVKDIIALYTVYTWYHFLEPKKAFIAVSGMYGTGKSAVAAILKAYGRYAIETSPGARSSEFELALTRGVYIVDEAEQLRKSELARLRRIHDGLKVTKFMGKKGGYQLLELLLNTPVVLIGTHLPPDPALLSRALVVKMHYGKPKEQPPHPYSAEARRFRAEALMTHINTYRDFVNHYRGCVEKWKHKLGARELDVFAPICAVDRLVGGPVPEEALVDYVAFSQYAAITVLRARRVVFDIAREILDRGARIGKMVEITESDFNLIVEDAAAKYGMGEREKDYVLTYFRSAAYLDHESSTPVLLFYRQDLERLADIEVDAKWFINKYAPGLLSPDTQVE